MRAQAIGDAVAVPRRAGHWRRRRCTGLAGVAVSAAFLYFLYRTIDLPLVGRTLLAADPALLTIAVVLILPITYLRALRFFWVAPAGSLPDVREAFRLTLVSSAFNLFVPAKAGDLAKSYFVARRSDTPAGVAVAVVAYERLCDVFGLLAWCLLGWAAARPHVAGLPAGLWLVFAALALVCGVLISSERLAAVLPARFAGIAGYPRLRWLHELAAGWPNLLRGLRGRRRFIVAFSLALWLAHLFQIWMFTVALSAPISFAVCASLAAVALMAGQLPLTFAGLGARDVALVVLLSGYMTAEAAAALGLLVSTRNFLPPLVAIPLMPPYLSSAVQGLRRGRDQKRPE